MLRLTQQITKLAIIILCIIVGLSYLLALKPISYLYSQGLSRPAKQEPTNKIGQYVRPKGSVPEGWVKYEIEIIVPDTAVTTTLKQKTSRYLVKRSLLGQEKIDNAIYLREEYSLLPHRFTYQVLKNARNGLIKEALFQRWGLPAVEINPDRFRLALGQLPPLKQITRDEKLETILESSALEIISQEKTTCLLPESGKKLRADWLTYTDPSQKTRFMVWQSQDVPFTNIIKSVYISGNTSVTINLLDFGLSGAQSSITTPIIKFGDKTIK